MSEEKGAGFPAPFPSVIRSHRMDTKEPKLHRFHKRMSDGRIFPIGQILKIVTAAKTRPNAKFPQTLRSTHGGSAFEILKEWRDYCQNEINRRGGLLIREGNPRRTEAKKRTRVICNCRWCGFQLDSYKPVHSRFCDPRCRQCFWS